VLLPLSPPKRWADVWPKIIKTKPIPGIHPLAHRFRNSNTLGFDKGLKHKELSLSRKKVKKN
jgi:hypothetical protein